MKRIKRNKLFLFVIVVLASVKSNVLFAQGTLLPLIITTLPIVPANFCNDATFNVSFSTNISANPGNTFSLELSDPFGSFAGPFPNIVGTLSSTSTTGTIVAQLNSPLTPAGNGYRIRVISSNPAATGSDNGSNLTISAVILNGIAMIQFSGNPFFCGGVSKTFTVGSIPDATNYTWAPPAGATILSGQGTQTCVISFPSSGASGLVTVFGSNANCTGTPLDYLVTANPIPAAPTVANVTGCSGTPIDLALLNPPAINFSVTNPYTGPSTTYTATVTDMNGCTSLPSAPANITINPLPSATITAGGLTTFCNGGSVTLNAPVAANRFYQWKKGANIISGAFLSSYTATTGGNYRVIVTNTITGCSKTTGSATVVTVNALPTATITPQGPTSFCAGGSVVLAANTGAGLTYQWKKGNGNIPSATQQTYTATTAGTYKVIVTNTNSCSKTSGGITVSVPCKLSESEGAFAVKVYPNPAHDFLTVSIYVKEVSGLTLQLIDIMGRIILSENETANEGLNAYRLGLNHISKGIYMLEVKSGSESWNTKVVIE